MADNQSNADDILKQFHPELFHKRKLEAGKGQKPSSQPTAEATVAPKKITKVANIHEAPVRKKRTRRIITFSDITYSISSGLSDLLSGMANLVPKTFIKALVNIYTLIALAVLIPAGIYFYTWYNTPPHFYTDHCYKRFAELHTEFKKNRIAGISDDEWNTFISDTEEEMDEMIYNLEHTADVEDQIRQLIMWAGRDSLLRMIQKKGVGTQKEEEAYKRYFDKIKDIEYVNSPERRRRIERFGN